jgi:hypothetical protein
MQYRLALAASLVSILWTHQHDSMIHGALAFAPAKYRWWPSTSTMTHTRQHPTLISRKSPFPLHTRRAHWLETSATSSFDDTDETNHENQDGLLLLKEAKAETHSKMVELVALGAWLARGDQCLYPRQQFRRSMAGSHDARPGTRIFLATHAWRHALWRRCTFGRGY